MTLYIYRVGWTYPTRNSITRAKSIKISICTRIPLGQVRPVEPTGQIGRLLPDRLQRLTGQTARAYRSDRFVLSNVNFDSHREHLVGRRKGVKGSKRRRLILFLGTNKVSLFLLTTMLTAFSTETPYLYHLNRRYSAPSRAEHACQGGQVHVSVETHSWVAGSQTKLLPLWRKWQQAAAQVYKSPMA